MRPDEATVAARCKQAEANGLVRVYFPNGTSFMSFEEHCYDCRHYTPDGDDSFATCAWKILDAIYDQSICREIYGYGTSYHNPDDMEVINLFPRCKRWTRKDDNDPSREPPKPDIPGQMTFGDLDIPVEIVPWVERLVLP